jgi:hypothetical protein
MDLMILSHLTCLHLHSHINYGKGKGTAKSE